MKTKIWLAAALVALLSVVGWGVQGQRRSPRVARWEYMVVELHLKSTVDEWETQLNKYGLQGWELASEHQYENSSTVRYTLKRMRQ